MLVFGGLNIVMRFLISHNQKVLKSIVPITYGSFDFSHSMVYKISKN